MNPRLLLVLAAFVFHSTPLAHAQKPLRSLVVSAVAYEVAATNPLVAECAKEDSDPKESLKKLSALVSRRMAKVAALTSITTRSGQTCVLRAGTVSLDFSPVLGADGEEAGITGTFEVGDRKQAFKATIPSGGAYFAGQLESKGSAQVLLVFIKYSTQDLETGS